MGSFNLASIVILFLLSNNIHNPGKKTKPHCNIWFLTTNERNNKIYSEIILARRRTMWECRICRRILEEEDETCWSCSGLREHVEKEAITSNTVQTGESDEDNRQFTWECSICRRLLEDEDKSCWSCGSSRPGELEGSVKSYMKNGWLMKTKNGYDLGSWKCGKGRAFTHIPTNFIILLKINSINNHLEKRGEQAFGSKNVRYKWFWMFYEKWLIDENS